MDQNEANATLENWEYAGKIAGSAYVDEYVKLARLFLCDRMMEKEGVDKEAVLSFAKKIFTSPAGRVLGLTSAALGAGGVAGHALTAKNTKEQVDMQVKAVAPKLFQAGFISGARRGFLAGAKKMHAALSGRREK